MCRVGCQLEEEELGASVLDCAGVENAAAEVGSVEVDEGMRGWIDIVASFEELFDLVCGEGVLKVASSQHASVIMKASTLPAMRALAVCTRCVPVGGVGVDSVQAEGMSRCIRDTCIWGDRGSE